MLTNWDTVLTGLGLLVWAVKSTRWGKANAQALKIFADVIENLDSREVKKAVKYRSRNLPKAVVDAIDDAVNTVDEKKETPFRKKVVVREALRGIAPEKK